MSQEIRVGVAGLTHGHVGGLIESWKTVEGARLVSVADPTPLMKEHGPKFERQYTSWQEMLEKESLDALVVTSNNVESAEIAVQALQKGVPCMVEKAMAANAADADRMLAAQQSSGKTLMINWPIAWWPWVEEVKRQIDEGAIGPVFHFRLRLGHHGPKEIGCDPWFVEWLYDEKLSGGGAMADFCCYGAVVCRWYFGMPESVYCVKGNYTKDYDVAEDHAVCLLKYPKMSAVIEGTWATYGMDASANPVVHGKNGTLGVFDQKVALSLPDVPDVVRESPALEWTSPAPYFWNCVKTGATPTGIRNPQISADACRILDAAAKSAKSGCAEKP